MSYVIANLDGADEGYAETRAEVVQALREIAARSPGVIGELFVEEYDAAGAPVGEAVPAAEMLGSATIVSGIIRLAPVVKTTVASDDAESVRDTEGTRNLIPSPSTRAL